MGRALNTLCGVKFFLRTIFMGAPLTLMLGSNLVTNELENSFNIEEKLEGVSVGSSAPPGHDSTCKQSSLGRSTRDVLNVPFRPCWEFV